jgi:hypothetical protein
MNDEIKHLLAEGMCVRAGESLDAIIIQCGAPILSSMMLSRICGPTFAISEPPQETDKLDIDWLLRHTIEVSFLRTHCPKTQVVGVCNN